MSIDNPELVGPQIEIADKNINSPQEKTPHEQNVEKVRKVWDEVDKDRKMSVDERRVREMVIQKGILPISGESQRTPEDQDKELGRTITEALNSDEFLSRLKEFEDKDRNAVIGASLEYMTLHRQGDGLDEFLNSLKNGRVDNESISKGLIKSIAQKLEIEDIHSPESQRKIFDYYYTRTEVEGYVFHGFNGAFEESIRKNGLNPSERMWDWEDLARVQEIGAKRGKNMLLGWGFINSKDKTFYESSGDNTYRYAYASPEWFAQFTSEGFHVKNTPDRKQAYYRRDYESAKKNILELCDEMQSSKPEDITNRKAYPNITDQERVQITDFFEKYWKIFAGEKSSPKAALIKNSAVHPLSEELKRKDYELNLEFLSETGVEYAIDFLRRDAHDASIDSSIKPEDITIVDLPEYSQVHPV